MKRLTILLAAFLLLASCNDRGYTGGYDNYQTYTNPQGQQMVVVHDNGNDVLMDYILFNQLMNAGGYRNVITHYHEYPTQTRPYTPSYVQGWRSSNISSSTYRNQSDGTGSGLRSNPNRSTSSGFRNVTPPSSGFRSSKGSSSSTFSRPSSTPTYTRPSGTTSSGWRSTTTPSSGFRSSSPSSSSSSSRSSSGFRSKN